MIAATLALAFLLGSIPFSWILVWALRGVDLRSVGSGNPGATNAIRVVGPFWGGVAMALDVLKGVAAAAGVPILAGEAAREWLPALCGLAAILGNVFCPFLKFKGGKAVSTAGGVFLGLAPRFTLIVAVVFFALFKATGKASIGSLACAALLPALLTLGWMFDWGDRPTLHEVALVWAAATLVVARHKDNIRRLLSGEESATLSKGAER